MWGSIPYPFCNMLKKKKSERVHPMDYGYVPVDPDPDFSVEHNERVIRNTIKSTKANMRRKGREHDDDYRERSEAVAHYVKSQQQGRVKHNIGKYFGKHLAYLRGEEVIARIQDQLRVIGKDGKIIRQRGQA